MKDLHLALLVLLLLSLTQNQNVFDPRMLSNFTLLGYDK